MRKWLIITAICICVAIAAGFVYCTHKIKTLKSEASKYKANTETLLQDVYHYSTGDSLNAARVGELQLKLSEYEKYRASDAELIKSLKASNQDLVAVTTAQTATIQRIQAQVTDSIIYLPGDTIERIVRKINYSDKWLDFAGQYNDAEKTFDAEIIIRDSLLITETVQYKRFLGFLWKTNKIKKREYNIVSRNPYTKITGFEVVNIEN